MITNYKEFFRKFKIFEAKEKKNRSIELAKEFVVKNYKALALAKKKAEAKKAKLEEDSNISDDDLKAFINSTKLTDEEIKELTIKAENDQYLNRIINLSDIRPEWTDLFTRLFFTSFKQYRINPNPGDEVNDFRKVSSLLGDYNYDTNDEKIIWNKTKIDEDSDNLANDFGNIALQIRKLNELPNNVQKQILSKFPTYVKAQKKNWNPTQDSNSGDARSGSEMLDDDIRDIGLNNYIDALIERLPRGLKVDGEVKYDLYKEYQNLKDDEFKSKIRNALGELYQIFKSKNIDIKPVRNKKGDIVYPYEKIFKIRAGTSTDKQLDKSLEDFYKRLKGTLDSFNNGSASKLMDILMEANEKFGEDSTDIVYNENNIIIFSVKTHEVNKFLHNRSTGKASRTSHCIADNSDDNWNTYMKNSSEDIYNKLYYVYDFNLDPTSRELPFGVIIKLDGDIASSHDKLDGSFARKVPDFLEKRNIPYSVLSPMSDEEVLEIDRTIGAAKLLMKANIPTERLREILEAGADPDMKNNTALFNAINTGNIENIKVLLQFGATITDRIYKLIFKKDNLNIIKAIVETEKIHPYVFLSYYITKDNLELVNYLMDANKRFGNKPYNLGIFEHIKSYSMLKIILSHKYIISSRDVDGLYGLLFPEGHLNKENMKKLMEITKIVLDSLPHKKERTKYTLSASDFLENAIAYAIDEEYIDYFKFIMRESIERLFDDEHEDDFIKEFLNRGTPMPKEFANIMAQAIDEIYEVGNDAMKAKIKVA